MTKLHFFRSVDVERASKGRYTWRTGYSWLASVEGLGCAPVTRREAMEFASQEGGKAAFHDDIDAARVAFKKDKS